MKRLLSSYSILILVATAQAWVHPHYEDATIVERSELIVVGYLDSKSIEYVPHAPGPDEPRSTMGIGAGPSTWEHHAVLNIREVLKGKIESSQIPIVIHYGLDPVVGGYVNRGTFMINARGANPDYPKNRVEILDQGDSIRGMVEDAADDNIWFLRRRTGNFGQEPGNGNLGIVDPADLQPLKLKNYFLCYLSDHVEEALKKYGAAHPEVASRVQSYVDHLEIQRIMKKSDPSARFESLLPYYLKNQRWNMDPEARNGIIACGKSVGGKLVSVFHNPEQKRHREDIILLWRDMNYREVAPLLINLLKELDRFWAKQKLTAGWWNSDVGSDLTERRRSIYGEIHDAVCALRAFQDPRAKEAIELTRKRWAEIPFDNPQIIEECTAALKDLAKQ
jgi:hypothetical protein